MSLPCEDAGQEWDRSPTGIVMELFHALEELLASEIKCDPCFFRPPALNRSGLLLWAGGVEGLLSEWLSQKTHVICFKPRAQTLHICHICLHWGVFGGQCHAGIYGSPMECLGRDASDHPNLIECFKSR